MTNTVSFLVVGKLFIFLLQKSPLPRILPEGFLKELVECDLCLGFWVYLFLGIALHKYLDEDIEKQNKIISRLVTAGMSTLAMHLLSIGWKDKFGTIVIE